MIHIKIFLGFTFIGLWTISMANATPQKPPAVKAMVTGEKENCVIHVQKKPRKLITATLRACPLKQALDVLEKEHLAIFSYPDTLAGSPLNQAFEKLPFYEALQRMFAPYNYILYAESGHVRIEIIGLLNRQPNPSLSAVPFTPEMKNAPSSIPRALVRPSRKRGTPSNNTNTTKLPSPTKEEASATESDGVREPMPDMRVTDDQGRVLPPFVPNATPPSYDPSIASKGLPPAPTKALPPFVPITNKTGPVIQGPPPKPLPAFTPDPNNTGPK